MEDDALARKVDIYRKANWTQAMKHVLGAYTARELLGLDGDVLVGATAVGLTQHVGALRGLIQSRTRLGQWKQKLLETPTRFVEAFVACQRPNS